MTKSNAKLQTKEVVHIMRYIIAMPLEGKLSSNRLGCSGICVGFH